MNPDLFMLVRGKFKGQWVFYCPIGTIMADAQAVTAWGYAGGPTFLTKEDAMAYADAEDLNYIVEIC